jgi:hypothetical protein
MAANGPFIPESDVPKLNLTADAKGFSKRFNDALAGLPSTEHHLHPRIKGKPTPPWPDNLSNAAFAVVDLTDGLPAYAVNGKEHAEKHIFSTAKVIPMFAAFRLQERLRNQFAGDRAATAQELVANVKAAWKSEVQSKGRFKTGYADFPDLPRIFDLSGGKGGAWTFDFRDKHTRWEVLDAFEHLEKHKTKNGYLISKPEIDKISFEDRLKLMVRMSDNNAAGSVAHDVGLSYIMGVLRTEGFYSDSNHGLWFSNTYGYDNVRDEDLGGYEAKDDNITGGGTAYSLARFFTLLVQRRLVSAAASDEMLDLLKLRGRGYGSWYSKGLPAGAVTHSKVGLGDWASEAAIVEYVGRKNPVPVSAPEGTVKRLVQIAENSANIPVTIKYIAIALEVSGMELADFITKVDPFIRTEHRANLWVP